VARCWRPNPSPTFWRANFSKAGCGLDPNSPYMI
jgi:hypothetical protein